MNKLDDLCRNLQQTYECGIKHITGHALVYVPIKDEPGFCLYSVIDVSFCKEKRLHYIQRKNKKCSCKIQTY